MDISVLVDTAGSAVVTAATTDAWHSIKTKFALLLGHGDPSQVSLAEKRLDRTHAELAAAATADRRQVYVRQAAAWAGRLGDLLDEYPDAEPGLQRLVNEVISDLPLNVASASDHSIASGRDMTISALGGGLSVGVLHGNVEFPGPRYAAPGTDRAQPGGTFHRRALAEGLPVSLPPRPVSVAGREPLLADLHSRLTTGPRSAPQVVVLHGLGGVGKTSIAIEYAYRHQAEVGICWQFRAEDPAVLADEFARLADQLGARAWPDSRDPTTLVHAALAARTTPWLLIFDNVIDAGSAARFLPPAGPGRVLITSQDPHWPQAQTIEVPHLPADVATSFLISRTGDQDREPAMALAAELGGLPLALEQAGAYIHASGCGLADYLSLLQRRRVDLLSRGQPAGYDKTVATCWSLAFARLDQQAPQAAGLLRLLAFCAPEPIPLDLLLRPGPDFIHALAPDLAPVIGPLLNDQLTAYDAVADLRRYALVSITGPNRILLHRLVQAVTRDQIPAPQAPLWERATAVLIEAALPAAPEEPAAWPAFAALMPHAQAALDNHEPSIAKLASYLGYSGNYTAARDQFATILASCERTLGAEHPHTLAIRCNLAVRTGQAGDPAAARDQLAELYPACEEILGPEHPYTLTAGHALASWTALAGDPAAARDLVAELLPVSERVLGAEHPETLTASGSLARWTGQAGDPAAARDQLARLLPVHNHALGQEHPDTLIIRQNLAGWTGLAGDPVTARDQYAALLPVRERVLGPEHPNTLNTRHFLAEWTGKAGAPAAARDLLADLLPIRERVVGPDHPDTRITRRDLAYWTQEANPNP